MPPTPPAPVTPPTPPLPDTPAPPVTPGPPEPVPVPMPHTPALPIIDGGVRFSQRDGSGNIVPATLDLAVSTFYQPFVAGRSGVTLRPLTDVASVTPVPARLNHNRWIADCPDCPGAEFVFLARPLLMCMSCFNGTISGMWRPVSIPSTAQRHAIEAALLERPIPQTRNWTPGETPASLRTETAAVKELLGEGA